MARIVSLGAGNVASALIPALEAADHTIAAVYSHTAAHAEELAAKLKTTPKLVTDSIAEATAAARKADILLISLTDDATATAAASLPPLPGVLVLHTSGSLPISALSQLSDTYGSLYPLQTFTRGVDVDMAEVPVFAEGSSREVEQRIMALAQSLGAPVRRADSRLRKKMHIAAVFACNYMNHMHTIAADLLAQEGLGLEVLEPLIDQTLAKSRAIGPEAAQTGPARRGDTALCRAHIEALPESLRPLYAMLAQSVMDRHGGQQQIKGQ